ncbi:MAG TPA: hypothetical protein VGG39_25260 [Polyangiaceae bacterium]|jgi:hypothetical protein
MQTRSRNTEAAQRFAERRRREDEAPRLAAIVPALATLRLEIEERRGSTTAGNPKHVRLVVVESAPALFDIPCGDHACRDGGHDVTGSIVRGLEAHQARIEVEDTCHGSLGSATCGTVMNVVATATYK